MTSFVTDATLCLCMAALVAVAAAWSSYLDAYGQHRGAGLMHDLRIIMRYVAYGTTINKALGEHERWASVGMWLLLVIFVTHHIDVVTKREPGNRIDMTASIKRG